MNQSVGLPMKNGMWRNVHVCDDWEIDLLPGHVRMSPKMYDRWQKAWENWWNHTGWRRAHSPEMWETYTGVVKVILNERGGLTGPDVV